MAASKPKADSVKEGTRIVAPERAEEDELESTLRPKRLSEFTGQKQARENLSVFIEAAKARGEALDHVLFSGPPGLGKTTLAQIVARELGVGSARPPDPCSPALAILLRSSPISNRAMCSSSMRFTGSIRR